MNHILSVSDLTLAIKQQLEGRFAQVSVRGEISNFKEQSSGHLYFTLKDAQAQISVVLFQGTARQLKRIPKSGDQVILHGELSVYPPRGGYQIIARKVEYMGVGELLVKLHALKEKLQQMGWFDPKHKKPLPTLPRRIGVVTSPTGSVIQDILHILTRRFPGFHLILNPVKVQGEGAAAEIARAIDACNEHRLVDVLIVGRGGGSLEDLWAFNEEIVAQAIFRSQIPIISAVGHETDTCIADFVADLRAPTPSAAAELVIAEKHALRHTLLQRKSRVMNYALSQCAHSRQRFAALTKHPALSSPYHLLGHLWQRIDEIKGALAVSMRRCIEQRQMHLLALRKQAHALKPATRLATLRGQLVSWERTLTRTMQTLLHTKRALLEPSQLQKRLAQRLLQHCTHARGRFEQLTSHLQAIDPKRLLTKGYTILFSEKKDSVILSIHELSEGDRLRVQLHDGQALAQVSKVDDERLSLF